MGGQAALRISTAGARFLTALVDSSVLIDYLRGHQGAAELLEEEHLAEPLHASEITRLEVLAGMRPAEENVTRSLLSTLVWHPVDAEVAEEAGALGRQWLPGHHTIDGADLAIAATAIHIDSRLLTRNVRHFPMFQDFRAPY
jgi:predicted nucleic acid-binding protein